MKNFIIKFLIVIMITDFIGFIAWSLSGQFPADYFFAGIITKSIINLII